MAIDILNIKPSVISRDLKGKYVLLYGKAKSGGLRKSFATIIWVNCGDIS